MELGNERAPQTTLATDNWSSSIVSEVGVYAYAADLSLKA